MLYEFFDYTYMQTRRNRRVKP